MAEITWFGHACFRIRGREAVIVTDPVGQTNGYDVQGLTADIVSVSHEHPGHQSLDSVLAGYRLISGPGEYEIRDVFVTGIPTFHDNAGGQERGKNTIYVFELEDLVICHLGDLGHPLTDEQSDGLSSVDILIVPVGGGVTLDAAGAAEVIGQLDPRVVIPMQFATELGDRDRDPLERFLKSLGLTEVEQTQRYSVKKTDLAESMQVVVLVPQLR